MRNAITDIVGKKFHRLSVIRICGKTNSGMTKVLCKCDCGSERECAAADVKRGHAKSCGCLQREAVRRTMTTHGATVNKNASPEYRIWCSAKERCTNASCPRYADYGGRGITMCSRWVDSFSTFYADMGPRPTKSHTLDRIDNNKGYSKANCRWATRTEQANNTRVNCIITFDGKSLTTAEWSRLVGINSKVLSARIRNGWTACEALTTPVHRSNKLVTLRKSATTLTPMLNKVMNPMSEIRASERRR